MRLIPASQANLSPKETYPDNPLQAKRTEKNLQFSKPPKWRFGGLEVTWNTAKVAGYKKARSA